MTQTPSQSSTVDQHDPDWAPTARPHEPRRRPSSASSSTDSAANSTSSTAEDEEDEDDEDEYDKRIERTGCSAENEALQMCYAETHDWRACKDAMQAFRDCWKRNGNVETE